MEFLSKTEFKRFINGLMEDYALYGTLKKDDMPAYGAIESFKDLTLKDRPSCLSPKEFIFPPEEKLLTFDLVKNTAHAVTEAPSQAIIGLAPCDLHAIALMDRVFKGNKPDPNYIKRRKRTILIGADCAPDAYCFCSSVETAEAVKKDFDLYLHILKNGYAVSVGSRKGQSILKKYSKTRAATNAEIKAAEKGTSSRLRKIKTKLETSPKTLPDVYASSEDNPVWKKIGEKCTGCGSCNHVCPTCYCFDIKDDVSLDLKTADKTRHWDACTLEDFAKVAGGHDFMETRGLKLRHRMKRKFQYPVDEYKSLFCVGCGRCSRTCLSEINITEVTNELIRSNKNQ